LLIRFPSLFSPCSHHNDLQHHSERAKDVRLDRKDATGRGHETEKKGGAGKANWGTLNDEVEAQLGR
jgi:hypothetical protein